MKTCALSYYTKTFLYLFKAERNCVHPSLNYHRGALQRALIIWCLLFCFVHVPTMLTVMTIYCNLNLLFKLN